MLKENLEKYADLAVKIGANVKKDQTVVINAGVTTYDLTRIIAKKCYEAGAKEVVVHYRDEEIKHQLLLHSPTEVLEHIPEWLINSILDYVKDGAAIINVVSEDPNLLSDVDPERFKLHNLASRKASKEYMAYIMKGITCWTIVTTPNEAWAKKIFPDSSVDEAIEKLWDNIFAATRTLEDDPIAAWNKHMNDLEERIEFLNEKAFDKLIYKAPGTDLEVKLPEDHIWIGGGQKSQDGNNFLPNIPTEEVFTTPHKYGVNGTLKSTMPLSYNGNLIDGFSFTFKDGKIIDFHAEKGYDVLKDMINTDDGASFLGEVALVPHDSPISNTGLIFYNTLYDENASCHFAVGSAYLLSVTGGADMSEEEKEAKGINHSLTHVDFMVGSQELDIIGITSSGEEVQIFKGGNWAF